jgi:hypothetical protein
MGRFYGEDSPLKDTFKDAADSLKAALSEIDN